MKWNWKPKGFYVRMLLINTFLTCAVTIFFSALFCNLAVKYERDRQLRDYEISMDSLYSNYESKHERFAGLMDSFFRTQSNFADAMQLTNTRDINAIDPATRARLVEMFTRLCEKDGDIVGLLLYSLKSGALYQMDLNSQTLIQIPMNSPLPKHAPFQRYVVTDKQLKALSVNLFLPESHAYGIVGNLTQPGDKGREVSAEVIVLYSASGLHKSVGNRGNGPGAAYRITVDDGVLFDSTGDYETPPLPETGNPEPVKVRWNQVAAYTGSMDSSQHKFTAAYFVPESELENGAVYITTLLLLISAILCAFSIIMYLVVCRLSSHKVGMIEKGMLHIGENDLLYRIPPSDGNDEFSVMITQFNQMCDRLQQNIEKAYIYEIQQKNAELYALQTSINPHFLYNTLEIIRVRLNQENCREASDMIVLLSRIYRSQIRGGMYLSLYEELSRCAMFIELYQFRYDNFEYESLVGPGFNEYGIPKNTLQPLIENYFVHGLDPASEENLLTISAGWDELDGERCVRITVDNNGKPIEPERLKELQQRLEQPDLLENGSSMGLANVNARLRIVFGEKYGLRLSEGENGQGFRIWFRIRPVQPDHLRPEEGERHV